MFVHACESFEHGLEHFLDGSERSRKFAILHVDQAIELFLKEKVVQLGKSIYKTDGTTLTLHETFSSLKTLDIPEQPRVEELHDLRNTIQHRGLTPDVGTTEFYVEIAYEFVKRFLSGELNTPFEGVFAAKYRALMEGLPLPGTEVVSKALERARKARSPAETILMGYTALDRAASLVEDRALGKPGFRRSFRKAAAERGANVQHVGALLTTIMSLRNRVVHSAYEPTDADAREFLQAATELLKITRLSV